MGMHDDGRQLFSEASDDHCAMATEEYEDSRTDRWVNVDPAASVGRVLLLVSERRQAWEIERTLRTVMHHLAIDAHVGSPVASRSLADTVGSPYDVALIDISVTAEASLDQAVALFAYDPSTEIAFFCERHATVETSALASLGVRLIESASFLDWVPVAVPALIDLARARRAMRFAETRVPALPGATAEASGRRELLPLPVAETRFRESYIRSILASAGSRSEAAELAGVPYRTFCNILRSLGIASVENNRAARSPSRTRVRWDKGGSTR